MLTIIFQMPKMLTRYTNKAQQTSAKSFTSSILKQASHSPCWKHITFDYMCDATYSNRKFFHRHSVLRAHRDGIAHKSNNEPCYNIYARKIERRVCLVWLANILWHQWSIMFMSSANRLPVSPTPCICFICLIVSAFPTGFPLFPLPYFFFLI